MPLNLPSLQADLAATFGTGGDESQKALAWSNAIRTYTAGIVFAVLPADQDAARAVLQAGLAGFNAPNAAASVLDAALSVYAATFAVKMVANGATAAVPPVPGTLAPLLTATFLANTTGLLSPTAAAATVAATLDGWFRTGTYTIGIIASPWS